MRFSQSPTFSSSQCLHRLAMSSVEVKGVAYLMASGASYNSENSDSVGEANME